jgi:hypothetical protein
MKTSWLLAPLLLFSGCAYDHGIVRATPTTSIPAPGEVKAVLEGIPGVKRVVHFSHDGRAPIDRLLGTNHGWIEEFSVQGEDHGFSLRFGRLKERKTITMQMMTRDIRPASFRVADVRDFMVSVYRGLRARFPELPPEESFVETARGLELENPK